MKTICYLADASNPHTIKWCNYLKVKDIIFMLFL